jgi:hypothetical protein
MWSPARAALAFAPLAFASPSFAQQRAASVTTTTTTTTSTTHTTVSRDGVSSTTTEDCADPNSVRCTRTGDVELGPGGVAISETTERVVAVSEPPSSATQSGLQLSMVVGSGENLSILGGSVGGQIRVLSGDTFPGGRGGGWTGFFLEPALAVTVTSIETTSPRVCVRPSVCTGGTTDASTVGSMMLAASAGLQFMHFDEMDPATREQGGLGLALGVQAAATKPFEDGETSTSFGPVISLLRPSYNPGTARLETDSLNLFIVPSDDLFLMVLGYSGSTN